MKSTKKLLGLMLALILMVSLCVPALAADEPPYSITIQDKNTAIVITGTTFSAYKLFEATYNETTGTIAYSYDQSTCLKVTYDDMSGTDLLAWLGETGTDGKLVRNDADVRAFADYVYANCIKGKDVTPTKSVTAESENVTIGLESAGYYLVYGTGKASENSIVTAAVALTSTTPGAIVNPKFDAPTLNKQIFHDDKPAQSSALGDWDVVGDFQVGDTVQFRTITTVPKTEGYLHYTYVIHDTMAESLTGNVDSESDFTVKVNDATELDAKYLTLLNPTDNCTFELQIDILKAIQEGKMKSSDTLYTYYTATLNENAIIYNKGTQANEAYLEFSNNPYDDGTGKTTEDKVYAWTYSMGVNKVDSDNTPLTGAQFVLSTKEDLDIKSLGVITNGVPNNTDTLIGLVTTENGYRVAKDGENNTVYVMDAGDISIDGLNDAKDYYLYEIKAPAGYNLKTEPVHFIITATYNVDGSQKAEGSPTVTVDEEIPSESMSTDVINQSGTVLPTTGGMGTTVFYILGGLLVAAAVVLLVTRKRMNMEK